MLSEVNQIRQGIRGDGSCRSRVHTGCVVAAAGAAGDDGGRTVGGGRGVLRKKMRNNENIKLPALKMVNSVIS